MSDKIKGWTFAIVASDTKRVSHFIGTVDTYDDALKLQKNATNVGWRNVRIYNASLRLVKEKPHG
jgi:hypothetical protein